MRVVRSEGYKIVPGGRRERRERENKIDKREEMKQREKW